jgi:hypothetical protein
MFLRNVVNYGTTGRHFPEDRCENTKSNNFLDHFSAGICSPVLCFGGTLPTGTLYIATVGLWFELLAVFLNKSMNK